MKDLSASVFPVQSKLPEGHYLVLPGPVRLARIRLSLSQRERTKVRDLLAGVLPRQSKLPEGHYLVLPGPDDSKSERQEFLFCSEIHLVPDCTLREGDSHDQNHPTRSPVLGPDSRNPTRSDRWDAGAEIYSARNYDFGDGATECVRNLWRFCEVARTSHWGTFEYCHFSEKINRSPLTLILSPQAGRGESHLRVLQELDCGQN